MTVQKIASWVPLTDEAIVDYSIGTPEEQAAAAARLDVRAAEATARWRALPLHTRVMRRHVYPRYDEARSRLGHAIRAMRGIECERD